ncbi:hypothetical protein BU24DRAFT_462924 [Aaosphaeria arxii CBS 175.79]|uniref:Uncharacterized protein n=1 Tax=Aaosphaeria arxii CBS 175.79 TaxID=1450172 RepID=A0A6A5XLF5_9PLEO|nr:uncharacterized protein BU24DRAFT_462924 [Aaosphaeria arxii CBS 175.79]KAF2014108.1 hypothetical protein BU24DRAFT_462924 [Aaosphaeria arxii CBS 175.79]
MLDVSRDNSRGTAITSPVEPTTTNDQLQSDFSAASTTIPALTVFESDQSGSYRTMAQCAKTLVSVPVQALCIFLITQVIQYVHLCVDAVYDFTGRRARSKLSAVAWSKLSIGLLLLSAYHAGLLRLTVQGYRNLRKGSLTK